MTDGEARKWACHGLLGHEVSSVDGCCLRCGASAIEIMRMRLASEERARDLAGARRGRGFGLGREVKRGRS